MHAGKREVSNARQTPLHFSMFFLPHVADCGAADAQQTRLLQQWPKSVCEGTHHLARSSWPAAAAPTRKGISMELLLLTSQRANQSISKRESLIKARAETGSDVAKLHTKAGWNKRPRFCLCFKRRARDLKFLLLLVSTGCRRTLTFAFVESLVELLVQLRKSHLA